jgi:tetratricopeptide (TPR) repeat protein
MKIFLSLTFLIISFTFSSQTNSDEQLAQYYYSNGELSKALPYYTKVYEASATKFNFTRLYECMMSESDYKSAEKLIKNQISTNKNDIDYKIIYGQFYIESGDVEKAKKLYSSMIEGLGTNSSEVILLYEAFVAKSEYELALETLKQGRKLLKDTYPLNLQFAALYKLNGDNENMLKEYLDLLDSYPTYLSTIQAALSVQLDFTSEGSATVDLLQNTLLERIQKKPEITVNSELLIWLFIQKKNFAGALIQVQALDKRLKENGRRVMEIGAICIENKDYETARKAFKQIISLGEQNPFYYEAENLLLNTRFLEITSHRNFSQVEIEETINDYLSTLKRVGWKRSSLPLIKEMSFIQAFFANQADSALANLNAALELVGLTDMQQAEIKILLADIYVLKGDIWEASLLYMQVNNVWKEEPIGHEAKFKNAKIFYYDGEFDYAQSQLSVLKESTSKLIANDAMNLSILITDNFGLDSNYEAMNWFAKADLAIEQHQYTQAFEYLDSITRIFPDHSLGDEILFRKSKAMQIQGNWSESISYLEKIIEFYGSDILADDALFQMGDIYENQLKNAEKASEYYKKILFEYPGSLYAVESRKRFRILRGDAIEEEETF